MVLSFDYSSQDPPPMLWKEGRDWDEPVSRGICRAWEKWHSQLPALRNHLISHTYFPKQSIIVSRELHGFSDASETAYAGEVYLRAVDSTNSTHVSLVIAKTKVEPIKRLTIPRLELNRALVAARLLH